LIGGSAINAFRSSGSVPQRDYREEYQRHDSAFASVAQGKIDNDSIPLQPPVLLQGGSKKELFLRKASIDINEADAKRLISLPGVGSSTADLIIRYRETHGRFERIEDVMRVKTIGVKKFEKMKQFIFVN
jgi:competence ComEA-like helix-hairpin-helix protein